MPILLRKVCSQKYFLKSILLKKYYLEEVIQINITLALTSSALPNAFKSQQWTVLSKIHEVLLLCIWSNALYY